MSAVQNPAHAERAEQLEVARECLCDAFDIDLDTAGPASCALAQAWAAKVRHLTATAYIRL